MKNDRGAITLFIIIGLVIILSFFLILFLNNLIIETEFGDSSEISQLQSEITQMKHFVESCIEETGKDAVYLTGLQGGYYDIPSPKRNFSDIKFPVYW